MIKLTGNKYKVINSSTGEVKAKSTTKTKGENQIKLLERFEGGTLGMKKRSKGLTNFGRKVKKAKMGKKSRK